MPCKAAAASVEWIVSDADLTAAAGEWGWTIGLDTEFQRTDTFFPRPGLYQVSSGEQVFLLDPLTIGDFSPLLELLEDRRVTTIMHACSEDLELLRHHFGAVPVGLFDTQLAHAFLSADYSISFTRLVRERLGVELIQHETRSDWLARPLTPEQIRYAWEDVFYLPPLHQALRTELEEKGRLGWFREEMDRRGRFELADPDAYYLSMKKVWRMSEAVRVRLQALTAWRERQAMSEDRPRNRIVRDEHLLNQAELDELDLDTVRELLPRGVARRYEQALMEAHAQPSDPDRPPAAEVAPAPLTPAANAAVGDLRALAREQAQALGMAPELLGRKREVESCVRHYLSHRELSDAFLGWRRPLLGEAFVERLEQLR